MWVGRKNKTLAQKEMTHLFYPMWVITADKDFKNGKKHEYSLIPIHVPIFHTTLQITAEPTQTKLWVVINTSLML